MAVGRGSRHGGARSLGRKVCCDGLASGIGMDPMVRTDLDSCDPICSLRNSWRILAPARARWLNVTAACDPATHASGCRSQKCWMSSAMSSAAKRAWLALIWDFGTGSEPRFGSKTKTTPSQNVIRRTNHIAQPCFPVGQLPLPHLCSYPQTSIVSGRRYVFSATSPLRSPAVDRSARPTCWGLPATGV
jgi:hypothetical protein